MMTDSHSFLYGRVGLMPRSSRSQSRATTDEVIGGALCCFYYLWWPAIIWIHACRSRKAPIIALSATTYMDIYCNSCQGGRNWEQVELWHHL